MESSDEPTATDLTNASSMVCLMEPGTFHPLSISSNLATVPALNASVVELNVVTFALIESSAVVALAASAATALLIAFCNPETLIPSEETVKKASDVGSIFTLTSPFSFTTKPSLNSASKISCWMFKSIVFVVPSLSI